mmetsp:Transcript_17029/g.34034  ORF Transcript_17029/g.34034 Transcript_17029/m.34034 type:complete len:218 (+) Transcript_17029:1217-1870(+)
MHRYHGTQTEYVLPSEPPPFFLNAHSSSRRSGGGGCSIRKRLGGSGGSGRDSIISHNWVVVGVRIVQGRGGLLLGVGLHLHRLGLIGFGITFTSSANVPLKADIVKLLTSLVRHVRRLTGLEPLVVDALRLDPLAEGGVRLVAFGNVCMAMFLLIRLQLIQPDGPINHGATRTPVEANGVKSLDALCGDLAFLSGTELAVLRALLGHPLAEHGKVGV